MRFFMFLVVLGVGGYFAWKYELIGGKEAGPADGEQPVATATATAGSTGASAIDIPAPGPGDGGGQQAPPADPPPDAGLGADLEARLASAEAQWSQLKAAGKDPASSENAVAMAKVMTEALRATYGKPGLQALQDRLVESYLTELGAKILLSPTRYPEDDIIGYHAVQGGDVLDNIGRPYGLSYQYLNMLRGRTDVEDGGLRQGERLKVIKAKQSGFYLRVTKSRFQMDLFIAGLFAKRYPIAIGAPGSDTPVGTTFIEAREREPTWTDPETNQPIPYGHPKHIIGPIWLRLNSAGIGKDGIGIHGYTGKGEATGVKASNGCVRMRNGDAQEVYNLMTKCMYDSKGEFITRAPMKVEIVE